MSNLKHVGKLSTNGRKCIVAYRVLPEDSDHCLVVHTDSLDSDQHDTLIKLVESDTGQSSYELAEAMVRTQLPDGRNMLEAFHLTGKLVVQSTNNVTMTPNNQTSVNLAELNQMIAEEQGVTVSELAIKAKGATSSTNTQETVSPVEDTVQTADSPLSDEDLAAKYRSDADRLYKEAKKLREQAEALVPTKKKTKKSEESV